MPGSGPSLRRPPVVDVERAAELLRRGGVIAYPTEAVWGLGCDPWNAGAVDRILILKGRPEAKGMLLVAADVEQVRPLLADPGQLEAVGDSWPGPVTWVFDGGAKAPRPVSRADGTLAMRVSAHGTVRALCEACGHPVVSTSANPAGAEPARAADTVVSYFGAQLDGLLAGELGASGRPSEIRDARSGEILRQG